MTRQLSIVLLSFVVILSAATITFAATKTIEAKHDTNANRWDPQDTSAAVGDIVEWKLTSGTHGLRITNWNDVKGNFEIEAVTGQQPFNATTGKNDNPTSTPGQVLLRLKVKSVPPAEIKFNCIVHGAGMAGKVVVAAANTKTIEAKHENPNKNFWEPENTTAVVGSVLEWKLTSGTHGVRIANWNDVKSHVEIETVSGQQPFNTNMGRNDDPTSAPGQVLLRLKIKSVPPADINFNCIVHGVGMAGKISVAAK